jgi:hypothetical protein
MTNQHAGLSQLLAEQHITQRQEQAAQERLRHGAGRPRHRRWSWAVRGWWRLARRPRIAVEQPARHPQSAS